MTTIHAIRSMLSAALVILCLGSASPAWAIPESVGPTLVSSIVINEAGVFVVMVNPGPSVQCAFALIGINHTTATGRLWYATALEALSTGARLAVSYERSGQACSVTQMSIQK